MSTPHQALTASGRLYRLLLAGYPPAFRRRYGQEMAQVFHDCARDAHQQRGLTGLIELWIRTLGDLVTTVPREHLAELDTKASGLWNATQQKIERSAIMPWNSGAENHPFTERLAEVLDRRGKMSAHPRTRQGEKGLEFVLVDATESGVSEDITISRADVSEIQLAKGAMRAGVRILLQEAGLTEADVEGVVVAGAFGTYIDLRSAVMIGMLPPLPLDRFQQVGNAAGMGARLALVSTAQRAKAVEIADCAEYIELTNSDEFATEFARAMYLE